MTTLVAAVPVAAHAAEPAQQRPDPRTPVFGASSQRRSIRRAPDLGRLEDWLDRVAAHQPGAVDEPAKYVASWQRHELEDALLDLSALFQILFQPNKPRFPSVTRPLTTEEVDELRRLADRECDRALGVRCVTLGGIEPGYAKRVANRVLKHAALLHTDIALLVPSAADRVGVHAGFVLPVWESVLVSDGRQENVGLGGAHWDVARWLFDRVQPAPSQDAVVLDWYQSVAASFASKRQMAEAEPHLEQARRLFPSNAEILGASGALYETMAMPRIQNFVREAQARGERTAVGSERANLRRAEDFLKHALETDAGNAEARVRLGHVLGRQGRHQEAADLLRRAVADTAADPLNQYYAALFLGTEQSALGQFDEARRSFELASAHAPNAQSPYLALSQLARRAGDRAGALRAMERMLALPPDGADRWDPWWSYSDEPAGRAESRLEHVRARLYLAAEER